MALVPGGVALRWRLLPDSLGTASSVSWSKMGGSAIDGGKFLSSAGLQTVTVLQARPLDEGPQQFAPVPIEEVEVDSQHTSDTGVCCACRNLRRADIATGIYSANGCRTHTPEACRKLDCIASGAIWVDMGHGCRCCHYGTTKGWMLAPCGRWW